MLKNAFPISEDIHGLPLGEVFQYILSIEWGKAPDPIANKCTQDAERNEGNENDQNQSH